MSKRIPLILFSLAFLISFGVYVHGLNPVFAADDSPETATSCVTLGIQHPPGYPLHTLFGRIFSFMPLASPGFRVNLMAAFWGSVCAGFLALGLWLLLFRATRVVAADLDSQALAQNEAGRRIQALIAFQRADWPGLLLLAAPSLAAALLLAFSKTFWSQCLSAKGGIYTLQAAIFSGLLVCLLNWEKNLLLRFGILQSSRLRALKSPWFLLAGMLLGLGLANHWETQLLFLPPFALFTLLVMLKIRINPKLPSPPGLWRPPALGLLFFLSGLSLYAFLPIRSALNPAMDWGHPATLAQFKWVVFRQEYTDTELGFSKAVLSALAGKGLWSEAWRQWPVVAAQGRRVFSHVATDLGLWSFFLSIAGVFCLLNLRRARVLLFSLGTGLLFVLVVMFYFHLKPEMLWILDVFMIPLYIVQAFLAGCGLWFLLAALLKRLSKPGPAGGSAPARGLLAGLLAATALILPFSYASFNASRNNCSGHYWAWDYGLNFLDSLKQDSLVLAEGDFNVMPIYYLQQIEGRRKDVAHLTSIFLFLPWGVEEVQRRHPELGLDLNPYSVPPSGQLFTASVSRLVDANQSRRPVCSSIFHEVLHDFYKQGEPLMKASGMVLEYNPPSTPAQQRRVTGLLKALRTRHWTADESLTNASTQFMLSNYASAFLETANWLRGLGKAAVVDPNPLYRQAVLQAPPANRAEAWTHYGINLAGQGKLDQALDAFNQAVAVKPIYEAYANMAGVYNTLKRYPEAIDAAQKGVALAPNAAEPYNNLAIAYFYSGDKAKAIATLEKALAINPQNQQVQNNLRVLRGK